MQSGRTLIQPLGETPLGHSAGSPTGPRAIATQTLVDYFFFAFFLLFLGVFFFMSSAMAAILAFGLIGRQVNLNYRAPLPKGTVAQRSCAGKSGNRKNAYISVA